MAIALDKVSTGGNTTNQTLTISHTVQGYERLIVVAVSISDSVGATSVTYGGASLTKIREDTVSIAGDDPWSSLWYLKNPTEGTADVVVTGGSTPGEMSATVVSFTGVDQTTPIEANHGATSSGSGTASDSVTTLTDGAWVIDSVAVNGTNTITPNGAQTQRGNITGTLQISEGSSTIIKAAHGAQSMSWTFTSSAWCLSLAAIKPSANTQPTTSYEDRSFYYPTVNPPGMLFDVTSNSGAQTSVSTFSWTHTCTGTNRLLVVTVGYVYSSGQTVSGITYNSVALTKAKATMNGTNCGTEIWYLLNPASGAHSVAVTYSGTITSSVAGAVSFTNADQLVGLDVVGDTTAQTSVSGVPQPSVTVTTTKNYCTLVDSLFDLANNAAPTAGTGQLQQYSVAASTNRAAVSIKERQSPAGNVTISWSGVPNVTNYSYTTAAFRPLAGGGKNFGFVI